MKKHNGLILILCALALTLSACGGSSSSNRQSSSSSDASSVSSAVSSASESSVSSEPASSAPASSAPASSAPASSESSSSASSEGPLTFTLYEQGPGTLTFSVNGTQVTNTLQPGLYNPESTVASNPGGVGPGGETVWDIQFNGAAGNVFLTAQSMDSVDGVNDGIRFNNMLADGAMQFDILVEAIGSETELHVKIDSGWPNVSYYVIDVPAAGEWVSISIPLADFAPNNIEAGEANFDLVINPFVLEAVNGTAHILINNIKITCIADCGLEAVLTPDAVEPGIMNIFMGELAAEWSNPGIAVYQEGGQNIIITTVVDDDLGNVLQFEFGTGFGTMYIQSTEAKNLSAFADGELIFDLKLVAAGNNTSGFRVKADCGYPCGSVELPVALPTDNEWHTITVPIASLSGLNLTNVDTPISFFPVYGEQDGVIFQLANIRWEVTGE
jgi:hypothetical protein